MGQDGSDGLRLIPHPKYFTSLGHFLSLFPKDVSEIRVRMKQELKAGAPPGAGFACRPPGWMQLFIFTGCPLHFLGHAKPSARDSVLLIMDGHTTHIKNLQVISLARNNHVTTVALPPHCGHRVQLLDVSFMKPLNAYSVRVVETTLKNSPGRLGRK